ncbi:hypothetical protein VTG60DRAFT_2689 [Thermothelomyces hinnuleus]
MTSPTSTSYTDTLAVLPDRTSATDRSSFFSLSLRNCHSFCQSLSALTRTTTRTATTMATPSIHSTRAPSVSLRWPWKVRYRPRASETTAATHSRISIRSCSATHANSRNDLDLRSGSRFSPNTRRRSAPSPSPSPSLRICRPARLSVRRPFTSPCSHPNCCRTATDFGSISLDRWPGLKANGLSSTLKSSSSPGSGRIRPGRGSTSTQSRERERERERDTKSVQVRVKR